MIYQHVFAFKTILLEAKRLIPLQRTFNQGKSRHWTSSFQTAAKCCDQNLGPSAWVLEGTLSIQLSLHAGFGADSGDGGSNAYNELNKASFSKTFGV